MQRLIYISTARAVLSLAETDRLLTASRRNNAANGISGLLVVGGRRFLQAIEGPQDAVETTFRGIGDDPRHFAVVTLRRETISDRAFPDWTMGYQRAGAASGGPTLRRIVDSLVSEIENPVVRAYFTGFADTNAAAQALA